MDFGLDFPKKEKVQLSLRHRSRYTSAQDRLRRDMLRLHPEEGADMCRPFGTGCLEEISCSFVVELDVEKMLLGIHLDYGDDSISCEVHQFSNKLVELIVGAL